MEGLSLGKEPIKPASLEIQGSKLLESPLLVYLWIVSELSTLDETEDNRIFEPSEDGTNPFEGERVSGERIVGLHDWLPAGREGERMGGGVVLELVLISILRLSSQCPPRPAYQSRAIWPPPAPSAGNVA